MNDVGFTRRTFIKRTSAGIAAGLAAVHLLGDGERAAEAQTRAASAPLASDGPELLIVSRLGAGHAMMRSLVSQLLECGIHFEHDAHQQLPEELPERLDGYRVIAIDTPAWKALVQQPLIMQKLEQYLRDRGLLFQLLQPADAEHVGNLIYDVQAFEQAGIMIAHGGLTENHPALKARQTSRGDDAIMAELKKEILQRVQKMRQWGEFTNHYWRPAMLLADAGNDDARQTLIKAISESSAEMPSGHTGQSLAGLWGTAWLFRQTGQREPLEKAVRIFDHVLSHRPRTAGVLNWNGFMDDPLGQRRSPQDKGMGWEQPTVAMRTLNWTEALHMQCGSLAAMTRATGDRRYLDEALGLIAHCGKHHLDPRDDLLFHATRDGKPASGKWGRGHTHALYGMIFTLEEMDAKDARRQQVIELIGRVGQGLKNAQDAQTGLWHNEVSLPISRPESSCTAGIVYVFGRCIVEGWLPRGEFHDMVLRGWEGLKRMYWHKGLAAQCRGTAVGPAIHYLSRPQGWGAVPQLLMAALMVDRVKRLS